MNSLIFRMVAYFGDGALWIFSSYYLLTMFFGYKVKPKKHRVLLGIISAIIYDAINIAIYIYATMHGKDAGIIVEILTLAIFIYWIKNTEEKNKWKVLLALITADEIAMTMLSLVSYITVTFIDLESLPPALKILIFSSAPVIELGLIYLMSWFSNRKRKEPMSVSLIFVTLIMFIVVYGILDFFGNDESSQMHPIITVQLLINENKAENVDKIFAFAILFFVLLLVTVFVFMVVRESEASFFIRKNAVSEYYLEAQKDHYESLKESNREIRKIKHDMKNHMFCLKELSEKKDYEALNEYISQLTENLSAVTSNVYTGNEIVDAIIEEKMKRARKEDINLKVDGNLVGLQISALDSCTIFSNLLDNALEAVSSLEKENKWIKLDIKKNKNFIIISESNPVKDKIVVENNLISTSKKDKKNHGFGIMNIEEAVAKYDGQCHIYTEDKVFIFEIVFPCSDQ